MPTPVLTPAGLEPAFSLVAYYPVLLYAAVVCGMAAGIVLSSQNLHRLGIKPWRPTPTKQMPYESGMDPVGTARMQFDVKFYLIAILFLVFDVELLFLYPWAVTAYGEGVATAWRAAFGGVIFVEILVFLGTLAVGYVYAWKKGVFQWR